MTRLRQRERSLDAAVDRDVVESAAAAALARLAAAHHRVGGTCELQIVQRHDDRNAALCAASAGSRARGDDRCCAHGRCAAARDRAARACLRARLQRVDHARRAQELGGEAIIRAELDLVGKILRPRRRQVLRRAASRTARPASRCSRTAGCARETAPRRRRADKIIVDRQQAGWSTSASVYARTRSVVLKRKPTIDDDRHEPDRCRRRRIPTRSRTGRGRTTRSAGTAWSSGGVDAACEPSAPVIEQTAARSSSHSDSAEADQPGHHCEIEISIVRVAGAITPGFEIIPVGHEIGRSPERLEAEAEQRALPRRDRARTARSRRGP